MSGRSTGSGASSRASGDYKELRLPNSRSVKALIYFCGRDPRKAKSVRRYYDEDFDTRSTGSGGSGSSMFSWSSAASQVYLVETTAPYWYMEEPASVSYSSSPRRHKSSKKGRTSRASQHNAPPPAGTWGRQARVDDEDDDDYDDSSSDGSADDYGGQNPGPYPHPPMHPGMHPGMPPPMPPQQGPPPGAFQPMYGYPQHATPHPMPPAGFPMPPPPQPTPGGMPPPPPPGGHFVPGRGGVQVFVDG